MPKHKIIDYITVNNDVPCKYCKYRKELYKEPPKECKECGWINSREFTYTDKIPVYEEEVQ